jgi:hypothetical protein
MLFMPKRIIPCPPNKFDITGLVVFFFILGWAAAAAAETPQDVTQSNICKDRVAISWTTEEAALARINYGATAALGKTAYDERGTQSEGRTHYFYINGLSANTTYYYDIVCGEVVYNNDGAHYTVTTGPVLSPAADSDIAYGRVFLKEGAMRAEGSIVYVKLKDNSGSGTPGESQQFSSLVDWNGYWFVDLKNVKTESMSAYFEYSDGDDLVVETKGTNGGSVSSVFDTAADSPAPVIFVSGTHVLRVPGDYTAIPLAVAAARQGDIIIVAPGKYPGDIEVSGKNGVAIIGEAGAKNTIIENGQQYGVRFEDASDSVIEGFTVRNTAVGIQAGSGSTTIRGNIIDANASVGIDISSGSAKIYNNVISNNGTAGPDEGAGIRIDADASSAPLLINNVIIGNGTAAGAGIYVPHASAIIKNNIVIENPGIGIKGLSAGWTLDYNDCWGNGQNYGVGASPQPVNSISRDPLFSDAAAGDFHLLANSPCINAGDASPEYNDFDGSRSDMGIYGGPYGGNPPAAREVAGRHIFYNKSAFGEQIAPDKEALLPGQKASFKNYTSYNRGINGIKIDIRNLANPAGLNMANIPNYFEFRVGNNNAPGTWNTAPSPGGVIIPDEPDGEGVYRITLIWDDNAIRNTWLEIKVLANDYTGLEDEDIFYFGNAVGESGNDPGNAQVTIIDMLLARNNPRVIPNSAAIDFSYDYNRDGRVNASDVLIARSGQTSFTNALKLIDPAAR